ncbi:hypothetical protein WH87_10345 [Devosia epidermidihirudinis]|uniref:DUF3502 domain-containing protein n=1 Tax=Devosia epidermidihirudinis TaxID=1293439 RepID=A0A0F5QBB5_9HYPH|nr:ABC transporter substrate-binding protein [Devosia epidermidihirudinis]KKC38018.1 hypothetical protein WH87_10345 [Devosia epidermidihirudinis]
MKLNKKASVLSLVGAFMLTGTALSVAADVPTLRMMLPFGATGTWTTQGVADVMAAVNPILEEKIGAHLDIVPIPAADYNQRMTLVMSSREAFDIAMTAPWTNNVYRNIAQGNFLGLNDYLAEVPELTEAVSPELLTVGSVAGELYGIPVEQLFPKSFGFSVKTELADKYDIAVDDITWFDDLTPVFERVVAGEGQGFYAFGGRLAALPELFGFDPPLGANAAAVVKMDDAERNVVNLYATEEYRALMRLRREWHVAGLTDPNPMNREQARAAISAGTQGFNLDSAQDRPGDRAFLGLDFTTKRFAPLVLTTGAMNASMMAVSADSQHPVEALKLITLLHTDAEVFNTLALGIEGVNWKRADSGLVELTDKASYWPNINWVWGNSYLAYPQKPTDEADTAEAKAVNAEAKASTILGFAFDTVPVENEVVAMSSILANFEPLEGGRVEDVDGYIDQQVAALEAAGLAKVQEEMKRQITEWAAAQQ